MNHFCQKTITILLVALFALAGCKTPLDPSENVSGGNAVGNVVISIGGGEDSTARTLAPTDIALSGLTYQLSFSNSGGASHATETVSLGTSKTVSLAAGNWTITAQANNGGAVKAEGSWTGEVSAGDTTDAPITLLPKTGSGTGTLAYTVSFPGLGADGSKSLALYAVTESSETAAGDPITNFTSGTSSTVSLPAGLYRLSLLLTNSSGKTAARTDAVHIYAGFSTTAAFSFAEKDFGVLTSFSGLTTDGSVGVTTTTLTLTFDKDILGLNADDISITPGITGTSAGTLSRTGTGVYELTVSGIIESGQITVTVAKDGYVINPASKTVNVYIAPGLVASVRLNKTVDRFLAGQAQWLTATVQPSNAIDRTLTWQSNNTTVATVSANGLVTALAAGTAVISATANDGSEKLAECTITVIVQPHGGLEPTLAWIKANADDGASYTIGLNEDEFIPPIDLSLSSGANSATIILEGNGSEMDIAPDSTGALFIIGEGVTLVLGNNIALQGRSNNTRSLVVVNTGGVLTMEAGSKIISNTASSNYGGGVYVSGGTFTMNGGEISGNTASSSYGYGGGVYVIGGTFRMNGGKISGNTASTTSSYSYGSYGGGVYVSSSGTFTMSGGEISGNTTYSSSSYGGGVYVSGSGTSFTMSGGEISNNSGSGVYVSSSGTFTLSGSGEISNNGSGVSVSGGAFTMSYGTISDNSGRGVSVSSDGTFTMSGSGTISNNSGGGVSVGSGTFTMSYGTISGNTAYSGSYSTGYGGGVSVSGGTFTMSGGEISSNTASSSYTGYGGGVSVSSGTFTMNGGAVNGNTASTSSSYTGYGGGVYVSGGTFTMSYGAISNNTASNGGGVYVNGGTFTMSSGGYGIYNNTASNGGGVYVNSGTFTLSGGMIQLNTASTSGGGVYVASGRTFTLSGSGTISNNSASSGSGGGVYVAGTLTMSGGTISGNSASSGSGGGVYVSGTLKKEPASGSSSSGTIYGSDAASGYKNTASAAANGHAVYRSSDKKRNATAGTSVRMDTDLEGSVGGWE